MTKIEIPSILGFMLLGIVLRLMNVFVYLI